ncbi:MAG: SDR family NAD(P)-dependent oxidoreductase [Candidatus Methylomirabilales bacterium]
MDIDGKVAIVTGAGKRVGRAIALALAERGAELVLHYRRSEREAQEVLAEAKRRGGKPVAVRADLARRDEIAGIVEAAAQAFGRVDILVNSASVFYATPWPGLTEAQWDEHLEVNLTAPFLLSSAAGRLMQRLGRGKIVNLADIAGAQVWKDYLPYSVSKAGLLALTRGLAKMLAPAVQVNAIAPGVVLLPEGTSEEERERAVRRIPLRRVGTPAEVAHTVVYLIENDFVTGQVLTLDGGQSL